MLIKKALRLLHFTDVFQQQPTSFTYSTFFFVIFQSSKVKQSISFSRKQESVNRELSMLTFSGDLERLFFIINHENGYNMGLLSHELHDFSSQQINCNCTCF